MLRLANRLKRPSDRAVLLALAAMTLLALALALWATRSIDPLRGDSAEYLPGQRRNLYLVPAAGAVEINGVRVNARDGVAIRDEARLTITALEDSELVLVDAA